MAYSSSAGRRRIEEVGLRAVSLNSALPPSPRILVAVPDDVLRHAGCSYLIVDQPPSIVLHTSGLHTGDVLKRGAPPAAGLGSFHPLVSFPSATGVPVDLDGRFAAVEGGPEAVRTAEQLAQTLNMRSCRLPSAGKPLYHAAAVMAANLAHALVAEARSLLTAAGVPQQLAGEALAPLVVESVRYALTAKGWESMTGPLVRADIFTLNTHRQHLPSEARQAYVSVTLLALERLHQAGILSGENTKDLRHALTDIS